MAVLHDMTVTSLPNTIHFGFKQRYSDVKLYTSTTMTFFQYVVEKFGLHAIRTFRITYLRKFRVMQHRFDLFIALGLKGHLFPATLYYPLY